MNASAPLVIDQALFGYSDGHRQLASSLMLSPRDSYELAARSDLVPGARLDATESYLTGFLLAESGTFAFIRTWLAPEMPRPGCVWSHVLLLPKSFLSRQVDLGVLSGEFQRPSKDSIAVNYGRRITLEKEQLRSLASPKLVSDVLGAYYGSRECKTPVSPGLEFERSLLAVWSQQWPRLRLEFAVRTAFGTAPSPDKGLTIRVSGGADEHPQLPTANDWQLHATDDAVASSVTPLRRFLWRYGKDMLQPRRAFKHLVELHAQVGKNGRRPEFLDVEWLLEDRKNPRNGATLKLDLLGISTSALSMVPMILATDFARLLTTVKPVERQAATRENLIEALGRLQQRELVVIASTLIDAPVQSADTLALSEAVVENAKEEAINSTMFPVDLALLVLNRVPECLSKYDVNRLDSRQTQKLLSIAVDDTGKLRLLTRLLGDPAEDWIVSSIIPVGSLALEAAIALRRDGRLDPSWRQILSQHSRPLLSSGLNSLTGIDKIADVVQLLAFPLDSSVDPAQWAKAVGEDGRVKPSDNLLIVSAFIFVLCQREGPAMNMSLAARYLSYLRSAVILNTLPHSARIFLEQNLPTTPDFWDINRRLLKVLRRAVRDGAVVGSYLETLSLTSEERNYVMGMEKERNPFDLSALLRLFRD